MAKHENVGAIDIHGAFIGQDARFPARVHPNTPGATVLAQAVFKALTGKG